MHELDEMMIELRLMVVNRCLKKLNEAIDALRGAYRDGLERQKEKEETGNKETKRPVLELVQSVHKDEGG